jgi:hypothetical protein
MDLEYDSRYVRGTGNQEIVRRDGFVVIRRVQFGDELSGSDLADAIVAVLNESAAHLAEARQETAALAARVAWLESQLVALDGESK